MDHCSWPALVPSPSSSPGGAPATSSGLNGDFLPAVSIADTGCLVVGALAPLATAGLARVPAARQLVPAVVGGLVAFVVNVVIL